MAERGKGLINQLRFFLTKVFKTKTFRQSGITFSGIFISGALGAIFFIILARHLGPVSFGIFSVSIAALTLISDIGNIGTNTGVVRFVGKYIQKEKKKALRFLKLGLKVKIVVWLLLFILGWRLIPWIVEAILRKPELLFPLRLAIIGVGGALLFSFSTFAIQAIQRFWIWSGLHVSINFLRLLGAGLLISLGLLSLESSLIIYIIFLFLGFFLGLLFLPNFLPIKGENKVSREFFSYNKWVALFILIAAISSRLDIFLSTRLLSLKEVGIYSVAISLAAIVPQIVSALATVAAPKLAGFTNVKQAISYLKKLQVFSIGLAVAGILIGIPLAYFLIPVLYGSEYIASIIPFAILLLAQAIFLISVPAHTSVIYYFSYPKLFVWISLGHLLIIAGLGWVLISSYGFIGAALAVLIGNIFNFLVPAIWALRRFSS